MQLDIFLRKFPKIFGFEKATSIYHSMDKQKIKLTGKVKNHNQMTIMTTTIMTMINK